MMQVEDSKGTYDANALANAVADFDTNLLCITVLNRKAKKANLNNKKLSSVECSNI